MNRLNRILMLGMVLGIGATWAAAQEPPFAGLVSTDKVNIRSGADDLFYAVGLLNAGDLVQVRENLAGWYKIDPPAGSYSFIEKKFVTADASGKQGAVTENRVRVLAPAPTGPRESFKTQLALDKGATVELLGEQDGFYKIVSPKGVFLYVHQKYVKPATAEQIAAAQGPKPQAPAPSTLAGNTQVKPSPSPTATAAAPSPAAPPAPSAPKPTPAEVDGPSRTPIAPASARSINATVAADGTIRYADQSLDREGFAQELKDALSDNPELEVLLRADKQARYEDVVATMEIATQAGVRKLSFVREQAVASAPPTPPVVEAPTEPVTPPVVEAEKPVAPPLPQLDELERRFKDISKLPILEQPLAELRTEYEKLLVETLSDTDRAVVKSRITIIEHRREIQIKLADVNSFRDKLVVAQEERKKIDLAKPKVYTSVGRLLTSSLYTGDRLPLLYRIVDQANGLTVAYIRPAENQDHALFIGQYVGVVGDKEFDPSLKLHVIRTEEIVVLEPKKIE